MAHVPWLELMLQPQGRVSQAKHLWMAQEALITGMRGTEDDSMLASQTKKLKYPRLSLSFKSGLLERRIADKVFTHLMTLYLMSPVLGLVQRVARLC